MEELFVDLPYQKRRIGTQLLKHVKKKKKFLETSVYQVNTGAIIFYTKQGFRINKEKQNCIYLERETGQWKLRMRWDQKENMINDI